MTKLYIFSVSDCRSGTIKRKNLFFLLIPGLEKQVSLIVQKLQSVINQIYWIDMMIKSY